MAHCTAMATAESYTAYDVKTGNILWTYDPTSIGTESAYGGNYPIGVVMIC